MGNSLRAGYEADQRIEDREIAAAMRELVGQFSTPSRLKARARTLEDRGLMKFHEWPSGHWALTERGRNFLADTGGAADGE